MKKTLITILLLFILLPNFVAAEDLLGGLGQDILSTVINIINYPVTFPAASIYGYESGAGTAPLWAYVFVFMLLFSVLWLASGQIPLFKDDENKGPRKAFVIAFSALVMLATPLVPLLFKVLRLFTSLAIIAAIVLGVYTIWVIFKGGWASNKLYSAKSSEQLAKASQGFADAERQLKQTEEYEHKTAQAAAKGLKNQIKTIRSLRSDLESILKDLRQIQRGNATTILGNNRTRKILKDLDRVRIDLGKLLSFQTENDRIMTGMSNINYNEHHRPGGLVSRTDTHVNIRRTVDTETNDLGRIIGGIGDAIRTQGITTGPNGNIHHLIDLTLNAINILNRMERDVVLEEQMIEKI
ncbi:MAG: hypothetical protein KatS3mg002_0947 [Candidatus Woesearchaeota archaeon]|nr:MAG: hypothetical protein KatS3mg002_0947 [Candidatus Woesearchaeota archaeon]